MIDKTNFAEVYGKSLPISKKVSVEICDFIRNKTLHKVKLQLQEITEMKRALPVRKFTTDVGSHKPGMASGRYPIKATKSFLNLLNSLEANAGNKGLDINNLVVSFARADKAERRWHSGRKGRVKFKSTHVKLMVEERKTTTKEEVKNKK